MNIVKTVKRLNTRLKETYMKDEKSSLSKHSFLTDHVIEYLPDILAKDLNVFRLCVLKKFRIIMLINL